MLIRLVLITPFTLLTACSSPVNNDFNIENSRTPAVSSPSPKADNNTTDKETSLQWLLPDPAIESSETTLIMYGSDSCSVSTDSKDLFLEGYDLEKPVRFEYRNHSELSEDAQSYGTPSFVLFHGGVAIDFHLGMVSNANDFAHDANTQIFDHLLKRNDIIPGDKWKLSNNRRSGMEHETQLNYRSFGFLNFEEFDFSGRSLEYTVFSSALLRGADFTGANLRGAVFAHSDLRDVIFSEIQQSELFIIGGICPDGTEAPIGMNCDGRFLPVDAEE